MPTRDQVRLLLAAGLGYTAVAERLGIPAGQAYLIATGRAADGSSSSRDGESQGDGLLASSQHLANPPQENATDSEKAPTRPHKHAPQKPSAAAKAAGAGAAVGKVRDAAGDRTTDDPGEYF